MDHKLFVHPIYLTYDFFTLCIYGYKYVYLDTDIHFEDIHILYTILQVLQSI